jgi:hypothetical protein
MPLELPDPHKILEALCASSRQLRAFSVQDRTIAARGLAPTKLQPVVNRTAVI